MRRTSVPWAWLVALGCVGEPDASALPWVDGPADIPHAPIAEGVAGPLGTVMPRATETQRAWFDAGRAVMTRTFTPEEGLGPQFNGVACASCHEKPTVGGGAALYRNNIIAGVPAGDGSFRFNGLIGEASPDAVSRGVVRFLDTRGELSARPQVPHDVQVQGLRRTPPLFGLGLLAGVQDDEVLRRADPEDADGDGISGRPNYEYGDVGRLGSKADVVRFIDVVQAELFVQMGVTAALVVEDNAILPFPQEMGYFVFLLQDVGDSVPDPEMNRDDLYHLVVYLQLLAAPAFDPMTPREAYGRDLFDEIGCADCHTPRLDSEVGPVPAYSDLLLHDMGAAATDHLRAGVAEPNEFRTMPLWGVAAASPYLHDGRAATIEEAINLHAGEAQGARDAFVALPSVEAAALVDFLRTLGGRDVANRGMLPPGAPLEPEGSLGGPLPGVVGERLARFERGRAWFDHDFGLADGVGSDVFNADSCRACHFQPVIGGGGPHDLNVVVAGHPGDDGYVTQRGAVAYARFRFGSEVLRVAPEVRLEARQPPALYGMGLIGSITDEVILAQESVSRPDGIGGRVGRTADGRIGRFGWKGDVATVEDFVVQAFYDELGMTSGLPGHDPIFAADADVWPDPEVNPAVITDMASFLSDLAPPPRRTGDAERVSAGEALFTEVGCAACHAPSLDGAGGPVGLFSDLLLHEVGTATSGGVGNGYAGGQEFRTPPLWGVSRTGPWLHDGRASTLWAAVSAHAGEAEVIAARAMALSPAERAALIAFLESL